ncbi:FAD-dependent oxidoreductase [Fodinisporobacter ferrooxydans]|uniref:FAD-dependent oxidoreductase n=1 Tax=Fodinisporobacter ferrooxydans TaxID=2901836 RepID=A0ABY4CP40_9BACL|nr:FAD-dependent oxidoreductase [Alicyclobacillaceae bacterium MYW30-H2]
MKKAIIYTTTGCPYCKKIKEELTAWGVEYEERNVTEQPEFFNDLHEKGIFSTPVTFIEGEVFIGYRPNKMKTYLGIDETVAKKNDPGEDTSDIFSAPSEDMFQQVYDLAIIGAGPAGASAAVYAARGRLNTIVIDKAPGAGALAITHKIANYPGVADELTGLQLVDRMRRQAKGFGATFIRSQVMSTDLAGEVKQLTTSDGRIQAKAVFIAVGARAKNKKIKGEEEFTGRGVSYCSTCDGAFFQNRVVGVSGDNEEALLEAMALAKFAKKVYFFIPSNKLQGTADIKAAESYDNIEVLWQHRVLEVTGTERFEGVLVKSSEGEKTYTLDGVFFYMAGNKPNTEFLGDEVKRDAEGYIEVDEFLKTNLVGVFAGGDARRTPVKQAVVAAADGAIAAIGADALIKHRNSLVPQYS